LLVLPAVGGASAVSAAGPGRVELLVAARVRPVCLSSPNVLALVVRLWAAAVEAIASGVVAGHPVLDVNVLGALAAKAVAHLAQVALVLSVATDCARWTKLRKGENSAVS
jgi:hypothetical protein